jgi:MoxR-like ATPase
MGRGNGQTTTAAGATALRGGLRRGASRLQRLDTQTLFDDQAVLGLEQVTKTAYHGPDTYKITFEDGTQALVNVADNQIAFDGDGQHTPAQLQAALIAAHAEAARFADIETAPDSTLLLADTYQQLSDTNEATRVDALAAVADAGQTAIVDQGGHVSVNAPELRRSLNADEQKAPTSPRLMARRRLQAAKQRLQTAIEVGGGPDAAVRSLLYDVNMAGVDGPTPEEVSEREQAAKALGIGVPECKIDMDDEGNSIGEYELGDAERTKFDIVRNRMALGQRGYIFRGPPGSGKDTFLEQVASIMHMPIQKFNIGPTFSLEDAIGGDGLKTSRVENKDGTVSQSPESAQIEGPLARALRQPVVVVIQEPEGFENEMVRLHSVFGDNVGSPETRYLTFNSSSGEQRLDVHPDAIIAFTFNSGKEDVKFKTALHDRACNLDFEYPEAEDEARRYSKMITRMMTREAIEQEAPELAREYTPEEVMPVVRYMETLRAAHMTNPDTFIEMPGSRQGVHCYCDLLLQGYGGDPNPTETLMEPLKYLLRGSDNMAEEERMRNLREQMTDLLDDFSGVATRAWDARQDKGDSA